MLLHGLLPFPFYRVLKRVALDMLDYVDMSPSGVEALH
jgi:hypothetical protein